MAATFKQISRNEFPSTDPSRMGKIDVAYAYMDDRFHTLMIRVPKELDTPDNVTTELRKAVDAATNSGPKEITI